MVEHLRLAERETGKWCKVPSISQAQSCELAPSHRVPG